ncbi:Molybdopterin binding domain protein [Desulfamplus magnetovallimortis]|uniref:Molybdopterin binding domain protein n=1 Tax=Desulfamplus magnetovallimortis TaxID=1246637 RepID=A0A1W1H7E3_9BACT|nr:molybdopterin-binding protein [Desulfamplus magnetovallimortis]SLM28295.1 Molybdopterin binding domain protein [Desulfamplus magnetovallimortis]
MCVHDMDKTTGTEDQCPTDCSSAKSSSHFSGLKTIPVSQAVGTRVAHDITEIRPGEFKGPAFKRGDLVRHEDICHLMRLGKNNLYVMDLEKDQIHEDDAVMELASALAGPGITFSGNPSEGKLQLKASYPGLLKINVDALVDFNMVPDVMAATIHNNTPVKAGQNVGATRAIPLVINRSELDRAIMVAKDSSNYPLLSVKVFNPMKVRLVITGNEVYEGLIQDRFEGIVKAKLVQYGASLEEKIILPDNPEMIASKVQEYLDKDTEMIITTGGMSVDPDDVTRVGIKRAGFDELHYSSAVLPGAMFLLGYKGNIPVMGLPACGLFHRITIFDLILPRLLAGEKPGARDLAALSHGGLCLDCSPCRFPSCSFGKC